ncbi:hypothetical protein BC938DRAFT_484172 [Jimgerdemannia flammicorona]|uniref:DUF659 domain-containing protein n=1 Tax=Jimgerdemannia flammicorona TaxID=994334 RepID=A0A433QAI8_9FUNG|nr:hypothetical protein BC938DRAFT_484172 [Jimgerdemannia flammicorona]
MSFNIIENPEWQTAFRNLRPGFEPFIPSRKQLSESLLNNEYVRIKEQIDMQIAKAKFYSLMTDGWSNIY